MPKPKVDEKLLQSVAKNARLNLTKEEEKKFLPQLKEVLDFFSKIDKLDVSKEKPSFQPLEMKNVFREDKVEKSLLQEDALSNTIHKKDGYFKGPRVL
ncbi:MAG: Asp-tRNA(Asn)/Glu-tRNA(Gln) amidotransferase subunit GatC [archaeon]|nr:Asp-tRNA(Asn)/Glu-tRNA(Gln) amidotransferase subunit GatC [archaeon]